MPDVPTRDLANQIGTVVEAPDFETVQTLLPMQKESSPSNVYSGNFGTGSFPLHTDLAHWYIPPQFLILRCDIPAANVYTTYINIEEIIKDVPASVINRALFRPRRKIGTSLTLLKFCQSRGGRKVYRWDTLFLIPVNEEAKVISDVLNSVPISEACNKHSLNKKNDLIIINNWKMLHGRSRVNLPDMKRRLERVYLSEIY